MSTSKKEYEISKEALMCITFYVVFLVFFGGPIWWKTTEVPRTNLAYSEIEDLSRLKFVLPTKVQLVSEDNEKHRFGPEIQKWLKVSKMHELFFSSRSPNPVERDKMRSASTIEELDAILREKTPTSPASIRLLDVSEMNFFKNDSPVVIGSDRTLYFDPNRITGKKLAEIVLESILGLSRVLETQDTLEEKRSKSGLQEGLLRRLALSNNYDVLFSLMVTEPERCLVSWNAQEILDSVMPTFFSDLEDWAKFRVQSQVKYLSKLQLGKLKYSNDTFTVNTHNLGTAINTVESHLGSHLSKAPIINFLVYVTPTDETPLQIVSDDGTALASNAFLVPKWGGVIIHNEERCLSNDSALYQKESLLRMEPKMDIILTQLRALFGLAEEKGGDIFFRMVKPKASGLRTWEVDFLKSSRVLENLLVTKSTLQSLSHLLSKISNIVITDEVALLIQKAIDHTLNATRYLQNGQLKEAFDESKFAFEASDRAFFDASLLELLYFPEDQKYAIYVPLFLPVLVPVLISIKSALNHFKKKRKSKKQA